MKERPILFSGPMVNAILQGRKTQTRRIVKPQPDPLGLHNHDRAPMSLDSTLSGWRGCADETGESREWSAYAEPGDHLWVRETHQFVNDKGDAIIFNADGAKHYVQDNSEWLRPQDMWKTRPSLFMPRWASRITLEVVSVRVERLNDCSEADAKAEGVTLADCCLTYFHGYSKLWESINGHGSWEANPWVWVVEFNVIRP